MALGLREMLWALVAWAVSFPIVSDYIEWFAKRTPFRHITSRDGERTYMRRWWLFNPMVDGRRRYPWIPLSIRLHEILVADFGPHMHDHPWDARSVVLNGWYCEERYLHRMRVCTPGDMNILGAGDFHRITSVADTGAMTLFFMFGRQHDWGFLVDGRKVPHDQYLAS